MPGEFLQGVTVGANIANMRVMQQERMMELRSQEALRAVQERQMAAQAEMLTQHAAYFRAQAEREDQQQKDELAMSKAVGLQHIINVTEDGMTEDESMQQLIPMATATNPVYGEKMAKSYSEYKRGMATAEGAFQPVIEDIIDPTTGRHVPVLRTGPKTAQMIESKSTDDLEELRRIHLAAQNETDPEIAKLYRALLVKKTQATGMTIKTNPDGTFEIVQGPVGGPDQLTKTNQSKVQDAQAKALETVDTAERLMPLLTNETVGLEAFAKSWINDRILAQRFPELASNKRAQASQLISQLRADAVKSFKSDGNISDRERNEILGSFPKANDPIDSPARARMLVQQTQVMAAIQAVAATKRLGGEMPKAAALVLDDENVANMAERGIISTDLAMKIWKLKRN